MLIILVVIAFVIALIVYIVMSFRENKHRRERHAEILTQNEYSKSIFHEDFDVALYFDEQKKQLVIENLLGRASCRVVSYSDLLDCEVLVDNTTVMKGGLGRAAVGGVVAGGLGALIGASTTSSTDKTNSMKVRVITVDVSDALIEITIITGATGRDSQTYKDAEKFAQETFATIASIIAREKKASVSHQYKQQKNIKETLTELEHLLSSRLITEEEFQVKRQEIISRL